MEPKDFQYKSAERIVELFNNGQNRVLLADEVGLGKTIVARAVVEKLREQAEKEGKAFKVIYVCSNQNIIKQNAYKLGIQEVVPLSESRLSMQHRTLFNKIDEGYLIPITPATSLVQTNGYGNAPERALIYTLIYKRFDYAEQEQLKNYLDVYGAQEKGKYTTSFENISDIEDRFPQGYYDNIQEKLNKKEGFSKIIKNIKDVLKTDEPDRQYINKLRAIFCEISMDMLHPNLVIMDEFQRYRDIMNGGDNTEENRLAQKLFNADSNPKILLISATPYKSMVTLEEIINEGRNEHFEDFNNLMSFLLGNHKDFEEKWKRYCDSLGYDLVTGNVDKLIEAKNEVEKELRKVMVRTERYKSELAINNEIKVSPTTEEVKEYALLRELLSKAAEVSGKRSPLLNIDYVKSASHLLSFMQQYVEKDFIERAYKSYRCPSKIFDKLLIKEERLKNEEDLNLSNARLNALCDMLFMPKNNNASHLLWVPASMPYYKTTGIFETCSDFSKIIVFSRWGFVPRMLATVLSYKAAIRFTKNGKGSGSNALEKYKELLLSPFPNLARLFDKGNHCEDLTEVRKRIEKSLKEIYHIKRTSSEFNGHSYKDLLIILKQLNEGRTNSGTSIKLDNRTLDYIINIIIASPGICLWRCYGEDYGKTYEDCCNSGLYRFANAFVNMLGNDESQGIIKKNSQNGKVYERVIDYCMNGNIQAVFDEYAFVMGYTPFMNNKDKKELWEKMESSIIGRSTLEIDTDKSFCSDRKKTPISRWFACDYAKLKSDDKDEKHKVSVQSAFNSPFRPFVLASTSVGQEGLDFHQYCMKIVHWNLPSNPVDLEQRSGRIDRYECLAIRRNIAHWFNDTLDWNVALKNAYEEWHKEPNRYNDLVPYWCIPQEVI